MNNTAVIDIFAALAQETRLAIFLLLVRHGGEGLSAGFIATKLGAPATTLSFHLKELKTAGVICCTRKGTSLIYRPNFAVMGEVISFLTAHCCDNTATASASQRGSSQ